MNLVLPMFSFAPARGRNSLRGIALLLAGAVALAAGTRSASAIAVTNVTLSPVNLTGGSPSTGTVTTDVNAPAGGTRIQIRSNNTAVATVPSYVTVPEGSKTVTFPVKTYPVTTDSTATLRASYLNVGKTVDINVLAPVLYAVYFNQSSPVTGGNSFTGTVLISGPAPAGGITVGLSSDNPHLIVPASVKVAAGSDTAIFDVSTTAVGPDTDATVTATYLDRTRTKTITLTKAVLTSLTTNFTNPLGRTTLTGTVTLNAHAVGVVNVALSSNNAAAALPSQVQVPAGQSTASFSITTTAVKVDTPVALKATLNGVTQTKNITILAPVLNALYVSGVDEITGGGSTTAVAQINGPAPTGGIVVNLTSDSTAVTVPATVTVGAGKTTVTFSVKSLPVATDTLVTLTAKQGGNTRTDTLTVIPPAVIGVPMSSYYFEGGTTITGTVRINGKAPAGGITITLSSSDSHARVQPTINIPAGSTQANFFVRTDPVTVQTKADITASFHGTSAKATLTLNPPAAGFVAPSGSDF